jgi:hypothetical protein
MTGRPASAPASLRQAWAAGRCRSCANDALAAPGRPSRARAILERATVQRVL